jgi:GTPase
MAFKSGFVTIIGKPNVGKSTLLNALVGQKLSIVTHKASTTRHRILGVVTDESRQIVFSDTPGVIESAYELHQAMMDFVWSSLEDSDVLVYMITSESSIDEALLKRMQDSSLPIILIINKVDLIGADDLKEKMASLEETGYFKEIIALSALHGFNTDKVLETLSLHLPEGEPYFPPDQVSDRAERFFVSEIIREQIFLGYAKEIPYSCEVIVEDFKDKGHIIDIRVFIMVEREGQKGILVGKGGKDIKRLGIKSRKEIEAFLEKHVFLDMRVKVAENWRKKDLFLRRFGYKN